MANTYLEASDEVVEGAEELVALRRGRVLAEQPAHSVKLQRNVRCNAMA